MLDLPALLTEPQILSLVFGMMLDEQAFEPVYIVRQCIDLEHAWIIRVVLLHAHVIRQGFYPELNYARSGTHSGC